jgi:hypothetical protein
LCAFEEKYIHQIQNKNRPLGENSPNLVTLLSSRRITAHQFCDGKKRTKKMKDEDEASNRLGNSMELPFIELF